MPRRGFNGGGRNGGCPDRAPLAQAKHNLTATDASPLRLGFVPLVDAAPLVVAAELGLFAEHGLAVTLERQLGWANVRDKLTFGHLHASHALLGMAPMSVLRPDLYVEPLVSVMSLGTGGDAISLSRRLADRGVSTAADLAAWIGRRAGGGGERPTLAHVFGCSMHHYLMRDWLAAGGVDPDRDVRLCVLPPSQMAGHAATEHIDGFCVGEPWNTLAAREGAAAIAALTTDILPAHPEKVLAVTRRFAEGNRSLLLPLVRATLRACSWCEDSANHARLADLLAAPKYLDLDPGVLRQSLALDRTFAAKPGKRTSRPSDWHMRSFGPAATFPSRTHVGWLLGQMTRWGHVDPTQPGLGHDAAAVAEDCTDDALYRDAAAAVGVDCPADDWPPMPLPGGRSFDLRPYRTPARAAAG